MKGRNSLEDLISDDQRIVLEEQIGKPQDEWGLEEWRAAAAQLSLELAWAAIKIDRLTNPPKRKRGRPPKIQNAFLIGLDGKAVKVGPSVRKNAVNYDAVYRIVEYGRRRLMESGQQAITDRAAVEYVTRDYARVWGIRAEFRIRGLIAKMQKRYSRAKNYRKSR